MKINFTKSQIEHIMGALGFIVSLEPKSNGIYEEGMIYTLKKILKKLKRFNEMEKFNEMYEVEP